MVHPRRLQGAGTDISALYPPAVQYSLTDQRRELAKLGEPGFLYLRPTGKVCSVPRASERQRSRRASLGRSLPTTHGPYLGRCSYRAESMTIASFLARSTSSIRSTACFRFRWLAAIPQRPLRNMATATATTRVESVVEADARCTRSARLRMPTRRPRARPTTRITVQNTGNAMSLPTRI